MPVKTFHTAKEIYIYIYWRFVCYFKSIIYLFTLFSQIWKEMFFLYCWKFLIVQYNLNSYFYLFMLLVRNSLIFEKFFSKDISHSSQLINTVEKNKTQQRQGLEQLLRNVITLLQYRDAAILFHCIQFLTNFV